MLVGPSALARVIDAEHQGDVFRYLPKPWSSKQFQAHFQAALQQLDQTQAQRAPEGGAAVPHTARAGAATPCARLGLELRQPVREPALPEAGATEWSLPSQLPTMPGDLWTTPGRAANAASRAA
jgi:hypothetical protein